MKIVFTHTDFRIYWPARLRELTYFLNQRNIDLEIVEIAGKGSHYSFENSFRHLRSNWHCLFPDEKIEHVSFSRANLMLRKTLDNISPDIVFAGAIAFPSGAAAVRWLWKTKGK